MLHCHVLSTHATVFSVNYVSVVSLLRTRGRRSRTIYLGVSKRGWGGFNGLGRRTLTGRNSEVLVLMFFLRTMHRLSIINLAVSAQLVRGIRFYAS